MAQLALRMPRTPIQSVARRENIQNTASSKADRGPEAPDKTGGRERAPSLRPQPLSASQGGQGWGLHANAEQCSPSWTQHALPGKCRRDVTAQASLGSRLGHTGS